MIAEGSAVKRSRTKSWEREGQLRPGLPEGSFVSTARLSRMMAEDIKDVSKHCYLALSFAPTDRIWGLPTGNPAEQNFHPANSFWARADR